MFNFWPFNISSKRREEAEKNEHARERMRTFMGQPSPRGPMLRELEPQRPAARSTGASPHHAAPYGGRSAPAEPSRCDSSPSRSYDSSSSSSCDSGSSSSSDSGSCSSSCD